MAAFVCDGGILVSHMGYIVFFPFRLEILFDLNLGDDTDCNGNITICSTNAVIDLCCLICGNIRCWSVECGGGRTAHCFSRCLGILVVLFTL